MAYDDVLTRNDDQELAVRTVQSTGDNPASAYDDVYTRDNNGKLAVRVVGGGGGGGDVDTTKVVNKAAVLPTAGSDNLGKVYMYSGETDASYTHGYIYECVSDGETPATYSWIRIDVQPAGSSDEHNLGWFADLTALQTAHPTGVDGDFAILGSTDTVWVWDSDTTAWKDTDQKGQVTSVNNMTGAVTLGINDVAPTQTGFSGYVLGTDGFVAGWVQPTTVTFRTWGANE